MADNLEYTPGVGASIAADEVGGVFVQRVKPVFGDDGSATDVSASNPLPVEVKNATDGNPLHVEAVGELLEAISALRFTINSLSRTIGQSLPDASGNMRTVIASGTVTTVSAVTALNTLGAAGYSTNDVMRALMATAANGLRANIVVSA